MDGDIRLFSQLFVLKAAAVRHTIIAGNAFTNRRRANVSHYEPWLVYVVTFVWPILGSVKIYSMYIHISR